MTMSTMMVPKHRRPRLCCCTQGRNNGSSSSSSANGSSNWYSSSSCWKNHFKIKLFVFLAATQYFLWGSGGILDNLGFVSESSTKLLNNQNKRKQMIANFASNYTTTSEAGGDHLMNNNPRLSLDDFKDLKYDSIFQSLSLSSGEASDVDTDNNQSSYNLLEEEIGKKLPLLQMLEGAGVDIGKDILYALPTWEEVTDLYGKEPAIIGLERCKKFRRQVPIEKRYVGVAGQMNSGTTALSAYLQRNMIMKTNPKPLKGIMNGVPWMKHGWASLRESEQFTFVTNKNYVLPVIIIRDPYFWMRSMCESPYNMEWNRTDGRCPNLVVDDDDDDDNESLLQQQEEGGVPVSISWKPKAYREWPSLAHVWSSWYREYLDADFPRLMIRFEDLLLRPTEILESIQQCVGATWTHDEIQFVTNTVKNTTYFRKYKEQSGMVSGLIKYGRDNGRRTHSMTAADIRYASQHLDSKLMKTFQYQKVAELD